MVPAHVAYVYSSKSWSSLVVGLLWSKPVFIELSSASGYQILFFFITGGYHPPDPLPCTALRAGYTAASSWRCVLSRMLQVTSIVPHEPHRGKVVVVARAIRRSVGSEC